jgi:AcrR family transcriptional regulator
MQNGEQTTARSTGGRANQKLRTRTAILQAAVELMRTGREITMLEVAKSALVSEATAYRYFPDLASLLKEAMAGQMSTPEQALQAVAHSRDPVERIAAATEHLLRTVLTYQGATRAMMAATITRPEATNARPGLRFGLIEYALAPLTDPDPDLDPAALDPAAFDPAALAQLKNDLAVVVSAEALFILTDLCHLAPDDAIASAVHTATVLTRAALQDHAATSAGAGAAAHH